ncbi:alpha/beta hydrolase [Streptomyces sp. NPDC005438]|uniref:alpha/beta hydrolase n=1 Tax=Streptomyces sp. NPDC005438 TaxID=3156880 RepID=UPI0033BEE12E
MRRPHLTQRHPLARASAVWLLLALTLGCGLEQAPASGDDQGAPSGSPPGSLPGALTGQRPDWGGCSPSEGQGRPRPLPDGTRWECATVRVPVDYARPHGATLPMRVVRARAGSAEGRAHRPALVVNFGGPGASGVATLPATGDAYTRLHRRYDLVSFDPRGVGASRGVRCLTDRAMDRHLSFDGSPDTAREARRLLEGQRRFAAACRHRSDASLLPHLTTANTARDLDLLRRALGQRKLHYLGFSYGSLLGAVYAHLFPQHTGRTVWDGVVDPTLGPAAGSLAQARGFEQALDHALRDCAGRRVACPLGEDPGRARQRVAALLRHLEDRPLPVPGGRRLTASLARDGLAQGLYGKDLWGPLTHALARARAGDGRPLLRLADLLNGRGPQGSYDHGAAAMVAVGCADSTSRPDLAKLRSTASAFARQAPLFGPTAAWSGARCEGWPTPSDSDQPVVSAPSAGPVLLVGTTGDPATPYPGTDHMRQALGNQRTRQLTYQGEGHGAWSAGDPCVRQHVERYLLTGRLPRDGTTCGTGR